ncbi:hypothetical protein KGI31_13795 [Lactiplantibacillus pentosus]|uniref:Uncharacterized protein n=2 Tax=Lactiplantibacillus pentosus TaxID=1589 RepID=A0AAX6LHJ2_LACPE|nr:hypothetical protein [Lactiplantibacillus pentosus]MBU7497973.1 hypothetical protein [Lactiplantibacillus pentosus]MDF2313995.1 hypothetical protein [Lactiplantibacillus pentosus]WMB63348.1 hypothetical protein NGP02_16310 [Lactiplantibacillus pentosus]WNN86386.1 hypothetical protein RNT80_05585 [Lactiplantibacillus pentosus]CCB81817.1 putative uncharacterized protein lp_0379 [Lactiplantibacillus pentosus MP-10]
MEKRLNERESYFSMSEFLDSYYWASKDDSLGSLLGSVTLWSGDGELFDQAIADDWHTFFSDVSNEDHTVLESFQAVKQFVNEYLPDVTQTTSVSRNLTYRIRMICEMSEAQRDQEPVWQNWVAAVNWITNPNVVPVNESPFLKKGQSLPNPKKKGFRKNQFPVAQVLPAPRPEIPLASDLEKLDLTQSYHAYMKFLSHYQVTDSSRELGDFLQKYSVISEDNQEYRYWRYDFTKGTRKEKEKLLDVLKLFLMIWDYAEIEIRDNALHAQPLRKLTSEIWKAVYMPHNQRVQTEVWQNWLTAVHQATKSTDNQ